MRRFAEFTEIGKRVWTKLKGAADRRLLVAPTDKERMATALNWFTMDLDFFEGFDPVEDVEDFLSGTETLLREFYVDWEVRAELRGLGPIGAGDSDDDDSDAGSGGGTSADSSGSSSDLGAPHH